MSSLFVILFGITILYMSVSTRLESYVKALVFQGIILFAIVIWGSGHLAAGSLIFLVIETIGVKTIAIPSFLIYIIRRNDIFREIEPTVTSVSSLIIASVLLAGGFYISSYSRGFNGAVIPLYFGMSASIIAFALFVIISRKKIITHVIGYALLENGIFMLSLSIAHEMPFIVGMGVLLDVFIAVYLLGFFVNKVKNMYPDVNADSLTNLKD